MADAAFRHRHSRGFTLIELLVAITIMAIIAVIGWRGLDSIVRTRVALNADLDQTRGLQLAFAQMQSDCAHIVDASDIGGHVPLAADAGSLTLVRHVFADDQPSRVEVVSYRLQNGELVRRESVATRDLGALDAAWTSAMDGTDSTPPVKLEAGVSSMAVRSWEPNTGWRVGVNPMAQAHVAGLPHPGAFAAPPTGLEVTLQLQDRSGKLVKVFLLGAA